MNIFMNFVKNFSAGGGIRDRVKALKEVKTLLLPILDFLTGPYTLESSSCSLRLTGRLTQELCWVVQDPEAVAIEDLNVIFPNKLVDPLGMELLEL